MKTIYSLLIALLFSVVFVSATPTTGLQFSGVATSYIDLGQQTAFSPLQFTVELWVNFQSSSNSYLLSTEGSAAASGGNQGFVLQLNGSKLRLQVGAGADWPCVTGGTTISLNNWYHVAATYSATEMKMYINGVLDGTATITTPMVTSVQNLCIGEGSMWKDRRFTGKMADLCFWNVVRTSTEISNSMSSLLIGTESGLVANWKMTEGSVTSVADLKANYPATIGSDIIWFRVGTGVNSVYNNSSNIESVLSGGTLQVTNKTNTGLNMFIYNTLGQKVMEQSIKTGGIMVNQLNTMRGSFILKCVAGDGSTYTKKFIITD